MENNATIIALSGKGGVGKTSISAAIVKLLVEAYPGKKILAIDADPAVGLSTALGIDVKMTIDDIRKEIVSSVEDGDTKTAIELLGDAKYKIFDALVETDGFAFIAVGRPVSAGCYCKINSYLKEVISILSADFDYVVIDEAHNLLENDQRQELLASVIIILNKRNKDASFKFLTPFIKDVTNLKIRYTSYDISSYTVDEYVKTDKLYLYDIRRNTGLKMYDQYMNEWYECTAEPKNQTSIQFIRNHAGDKNIIYFNKPVDIEKFASEMLVDMPDIELCEEFRKQTA